MPFAAGMYYSINEEGSKEKPTIVLIHGAGANHLYWPSDLRRLPGYRVIAPDLPGHGRSGGSGQQSVWVYADQVVRFLDELGYYKAVFIGHSMGGCITLALALEHAENVAALGLLSCGAHIDIPADIMTHTTSPATLQLAIDALKLKIFSPHTSPVLVERGIRQLAETRSGVLYGDLLACKTFDVVNRVGEIDKPSIVLCGCDDLMTPPHYSQYLAATLGRENRGRDADEQDRLVVIPAAGHLMMLEQPQAVKTALTGFLHQVCDN